MDRKPLSLGCDPEQYSTLLWPPAVCNYSCIRQEFACYSNAHSDRSFQVAYNIVEHRNVCLTSDVLVNEKEDSMQALEVATSSPVGKLRLRGANYAPLRG